MSIGCVAVSFQCNTIFPTSTTSGRMPFAFDTGQVAIDLQSLNVLMAQALSGERSNVEKLKLSVENGKLRQQA